MNANPLPRQPNELKVPEGFYVESYTPAAGRIKSPSLNKFLQYCKFILSADADVTFRDHAGNLNTAMALKAGPQIFLASEISAVSAGSVKIVHDGLIWSCDPGAKDMTIDFPRY